MPTKCVSHTISLILQLSKLAVAQILFANRKSTMSNSQSQSSTSLISARPKWLPATIDSRIRITAWISFLAETIIIATGGAVRLTGSGLGCPTWPLCTPDSLVAVPELVGIHGMIEFGNRLMTGLVGIVALLLVILMLRLRRSHKTLWVLALVVLGGVVLQAVLGGIVVLTDLEPNLVGLHYVISMILVCVSAAYLYLMSQPQGKRVKTAPVWFNILAHITTLVLAITVFFGILTTGAGPHSGDSSVGRNGFNAELLEHVHAWPGYVLLALTVVLLVFAWRLNLDKTKFWFGALLCIELVQIAVGIYQARNGLPHLAVGVHMVLAALTAAAMTVAILSLKQAAVVENATLEQRP